MITIRNRIKEQRMKQMLSQADLVKKSGVSQANLSAYENDCRLPSTENAIKIARALNLPLDALFLVEVDSKTDTTEAA